MKIEQGRTGNQELQGKSAQKSEKSVRAGNQKDLKERVAGESKVFKKVLAQATEKGQASSREMGTSEQAVRNKTGLDGGQEKVVDGRLGAEGAVINSEASRGQMLLDEFDAEKQRLGELSRELKEVEVEEQAVLSGAVPEMTDSSGVQKAVDMAPAAETSHAEMAQLANKIVQAFYVGQDARAKKIVMMDVNVPGRGSVRVRLSKMGDSVDVRMRADNEDLARLLRAHREDLRESGASKGVRFGNIEVAG